MEQARSFAQVLQNLESLQMQMKVNRIRISLSQEVELVINLQRRPKVWKGRVYMEEVEEEGRPKRLQHWIHYLRS